MKTLLNRISILAVLLFTITRVNAQPTSTNNSNTKPTVMKTWIIEREIPNAGSFTMEQLKGISQKSCGVLKEMNDIQWIHSYVAGDKIYCIYKAASEELVREHATKGGFPANRVTEVANIINPETAN